MKLPTWVRWPADDSLFFLSRPNSLRPRILGVQPSRKDLKNENALAFL